MSSGNFLNAFYESDAGRIYSIRCQPETAALVLGGVTNVIPAGPATEEPSANLSSSRRQNGVNARYVYVEFTGAPPTGYENGGKVRIPVFRLSTYVSYAKGQTGTYLGAAVRFVGKTAEKIN